MPTFQISSLQQTVLLGHFLAGIASPSDILTLEGDLGAGKTTLTQAVGTGLQVPAECYITSPTFSLLHEYPGRIPLYHMDLYRLSAPEEVEHLGFEDFIYSEGLTIIEWPDRLAELMPAERLQIIITTDTSTETESLDNESRIIEIHFHGETWLARKPLFNDLLKNTL